MGGGGAGIPLTFPCTNRFPPKLKILYDNYNVPPISTEYQQSDGEWVLKDVADNTNLGTEERIRSKGILDHYVIRQRLHKINRGSLEPPSPMSKKTFQLCHLSGMI